MLHGFRTRLWTCFSGILAKERRNRAVEDAWKGELISVVHSIESKIGKMTKASLWETREGDKKQTCQLRIVHSRETSLGRNSKSDFVPGSTPRLPPSLGRNRLQLQRQGLQNSLCGWHRTPSSLPARGNRFYLGETQNPKAFIRGRRRNAFRRERLPTALPAAVDRRGSGAQQNPGFPEWIRRLGVGAVGRSRNCVTGQREGRGRAERTCERGLPPSPCVWQRGAALWDGASERHCLVSVATECSVTRTLLGSREEGREAAAAWQDAPGVVPGAGRSYSVSQSMAPK